MIQEIEYNTFNDQNGLLKTLMANKTAAGEKYRNELQYHSLQAFIDRL